MVTTVVPTPFGVTKTCKASAPLKSPPCQVPMPMPFFLTLATLGLLETAFTPQYAIAL